MKQEITGPVLVPNETDWHGDIYSEESVYDACREYNKYCENSNLQHVMMLEDGTAEVVESYILPFDTNWNGKLLKAGTWMLTMKIYSDSLWNQILEGKFTGFSIGSGALVEDLSPAEKYKSLEFKLDISDDAMEKLIAAEAEEESKLSGVHPAIIRDRMRKEEKSKSLKLKYS